MAATPEAAVIELSRVVRALMHSIQSLVSSSFNNSVRPIVEPLAPPIPSISANVKNVATCSQSLDQLLQPEVFAVNSDVAAEGRLPLPVSADSGHGTRRSLSQASAAYRDVSGVPSNSRRSSTRHQNFSIAHAFRRIAIRQTATIAQTSTVSQSHELSGGQPLQSANSDIVEDSIDFHRSKRRVQTLLVAACLFPLLCIVLQVTIVGLSGTIEIDELPVFDNYGLTAINCNCSVSCDRTDVNMNSSTDSTPSSTGPPRSIDSLLNRSLSNSLCTNKSVTFRSPNEYYNDPVVVVYIAIESLVVSVIAFSSLWLSLVVVVQFHRRRLPSLFESIITSRANLDLVTFEQRRSDDLLGEMLPRWVAESLKNGWTVDPETFDEGTVYFSDIPGFHAAVNSCESPLDIVSLLNAVFCAFDRCVKQFRVYKVETIGDSYVVASGIPTRIGSDHAAEMALMALEMMNVSAAFSLPGHEGVPLPLRVGINCGSVVTGVIGFKNPRYCLFGDTVNTASRMESTGKSYHIHCSEAFKTAAKRESVEFIFEERGMITVKGKGNMTTYWLRGKE